MENGGEHKVPSLDKEQWASDSAKSKNVFFKSISPGKFTTLQWKTHTFKTT